MEVVEKVFIYPEIQNPTYRKFGQETYSTFKWILAEFLDVIIEILAFSV